MQHNKEKAPQCSTSTAASPDEMQCTKCGEPVEIWSDEPEAKCDACGEMVSKD